MSDTLTKEIRSRRLHQEETHIKKQVKIAKQIGGYKDNDEVIRQPHRLAKHNVMDCGLPGCAMCGNPRHIHKDGLTIQEKRAMQDEEWDGV